MQLINHIFTASTVQPRIDPRVYHAACQSRACVPQGGTLGQLQSRQCYVLHAIKCRLMDDFCRKKRSFFNVSWKEHPSQPSGSKGKLDFVICMKIYF